MRSARPRSSNFVGLRHIVLIKKVVALLNLAVRPYNSVSKASDHQSFKGNPNPIQNRKMWYQRGVPIPKLQPKCPCMHHPDPEHNLRTVITIRVACR